MSSAYDAITDQLETLMLAATETADPIVAGAILAELRDCKQDLARVYDEVERCLLAIAGEKKLEVPGVGVIEIKGSPRRTQWRHDELIPVIVAKALDERVFDPDTGEAQEREAETVARVLRECISFGAGKITGLRSRGIQADEFCLEEEMHYSAKLPARAET